MVKKNNQKVSVKSDVNINVKKELNYYKIATFVLGGIILLFGVIFLLNWYGAANYQSGYVVGQQAVFNGILANLEKEGYVSFGEGNTSITLVPAQMLQSQREQTILEIMKQVKEQGSVQLFNNESEVILVPYQE